MRRRAGPWRSIRCSVAPMNVVAQAEDEPPAPLTCVDASGRQHLRSRPPPRSCPPRLHPPSAAAQRAGRRARQPRAAALPLVVQHVEQRDEAPRLVVHLGRELPARKKCAPMLAPCPPTLRPIHGSREAFELPWPSPAGEGACNQRCRGTECTAMVCSGGKRKIVGAPSGSAQRLKWTRQPSALHEVRRGLRPPPSSSRALAAAGGRGLLAARRCDASPQRGGGGGRGRAVKAGARHPRPAARGSRLAPTRDGTSTPCACRASQKAGMCGCG